MRRTKLENGSVGADQCNKRESMTDSGHCSPSAPSTSTGYISIARSTTAPLSQGRKYIDIHLLTREHVYLAVDVKCKIGDVYGYVCGHIGLRNVALFGLAHYVENEYRLCDPNERLPKYARTKNWQKSPGWGTDLVGNPSLILYLRVHTYVDYIRLIDCPVSLSHYYLQLRENVRTEWESNWVSEERCFEAAALALQADFGDYQPDKHGVGYFSAEVYFPNWVINTRGLDYIQRHTPVMHHDLEGVDVREAQIRYCREVSQSPCPINMHFYRLRRHKTDSKETVYLGIAAKGLELFEQKENGQRQVFGTFAWPKIEKLAFDRKKFTLASLDGQKVVFYTSSDEKARYLLSLCRSVHQDIIGLNSVILQAKKWEDEEKKLFHESYIYSDSAELDWIRKMESKTGNGQQTSSALCSATMTSSVIVCSNGGGQRISLVSDTSSNTTSGIVSDRLHTHEDSENEHDGDVDFENITGCDSSPLLSELSLATTGTTSLRVGIYGSHSSQQPSPMCGSDVVEDNQYAHIDGIDKDVVETGEGSSSVGPCSDRTITVAADDAQSVETNSTTGRLEEFCPENYPSSPALPVGENGQSSSSNDATRVVSRVSTAGNISIAELRRLTLPDYNQSSSTSGRQPTAVLDPVRVPILRPVAPSVAERQMSIQDHVRTPEQGQQHRLISAQGAMNGQLVNPTQLESVIIEPPPPPPYPYETDAQSTSAAISFPSPHSQSECFSPRHRASVDGLPNYQQALEYKAHLAQQAASANVPWLHTGAAGRWPTVSTVHPVAVDQLVAALRNKRLQQAQSEPGLTGLCVGCVENYGGSGPTCFGCGDPTLSSCSTSPYSGGCGAYRSVSAYQLANRPCCCCMAHPVFPSHQCSMGHSVYTPYQMAPRACTPNGLYLKHPRAPVRSFASIPVGHRSHNADCHDGRVVARVHSMYEAAKSDQVRRNLEQEYYRRFEQRVVEDTRRELRKQQLQLERQVERCLNESNSSLEHTRPDQHCKRCQMDHTTGKLDLAQLKDILRRSQNVDLPLMRALCNEKSWEQRRADETKWPQPSPNDASAHPLLRQGRPPSTRADDEPPVQVAPDQSSPRPVTWHGSFRDGAPS